MIGSIIGDIIGSRFEGQDKNPICKEFDLFPERTYFTDDTVMTVAIADAILGITDYGEAIREYYNRYPKAGYGGSFKLWGKDKNAAPYNSFGNGSAMRVSPVAYAFESLERVLQEAKLTAEPTHNHPEGVKGAQAIAHAIWLARKGASKKDIAEMIEGMGYELEPLPDRPIMFDASCQGTVPQAVQSFLESEDFEDAIRISIMSGGDSDTIASIAGAIAEPFYNDIQNDIMIETFKRLPKDLSDMTVTFVQKYINPNFVKPAEYSDSARLQEMFRNL